MQPHRKIPGFVDWVEGDTWFARIFIDNQELTAEMIDPLPQGKGPGHCFTIHRTKRGHTYLYWIEKPLITKRQVKKARQQARAWRAVWVKQGVIETVS